MKLPIFEFIINDEEEDGVTAISIVDDPAFQSSLVTFSKDKPKYIELATAKKKQICAGLSLIPNVLIYRTDPVIGEYFGYFSEETIERIVEKYHEDLNNNKVNLDHDPSKYIDAFMVEDYIVDSEARIADLKAKGIEHENIKGSWYTAFKIKDPQVFEQIVNGNSKTGFSIEAFLDTYLVQAHNEKRNKIIKTEMKKNNKTILEKIVNLFKSEEFERSLVNELGFEIEWSEVGQPVNKVVVDTEGNETMEPVGMGEFITEEGIIVTDEASNLVEIRELPTEPETEEPELVLPDEEMEAEIPQIEEKLEAENVQNVEINKMETEFSETKAALDEQIQKFASLQAKFDEIQKENEALKAENETLKEKLKEPINEPILEPVVEKKEWAKMSAYERALERARKE